jgi:hypothetical protein
MAELKTKPDFLQEIDALIGEMRNFQADRKAGKPLPGAALSDPTFDVDAALRLLIDWLEKLAAHARAGKPRSKPLRQSDIGGIVHMLTDNGWPPPKPLGVRMMEACDFYVDHLKP